MNSNLSTSSSFVAFNMKNMTCCLLIFFHSLSAICQPLPDTVFTKYQNAATAEQKGKCLLEYFRQQIKTPKIKEDILVLKSWFEKNKDQTGMNYTNVGLALVLNKNGDYPAALDVLFSTLPLFEKQKDDFGMRNTYNTISGTYLSAKDFINAAEYSKKEIVSVSTENDKYLLASIYNGIACIYGEGKMPDSGMVYALKAIQLDTEIKNDYHLAISTSTLGENYIAAGEYDIALPYLRRTALYYQQKGAPNPYMDAYLKNDFAEIFLNTKNYDSANFYAQQALSVSVPNNVKDQCIRSYEYLYKSFEQSNNQDSLNKYFRLAMTTKDSIFNIEKVRSMQALTFREQMRLQEIETEKQKKEEERFQNIQYALIALGIVIFITIFLMLSRSIIVNEKIISFFAILGLLIVFEFINLLIHPWLAHFTHESPVLMLLALVTIAGMLIPFHHKMEHSIKTKLIEKNKAIRLAVAKKTIEKLETTNI